MVDTFGHFSDNRMRKRKQFYLILATAFFYLLLLLLREDKINVIELLKEIHNKADLERSKFLQSIDGNPDALKIILANEAIRSLDEVDIVEQYLGHIPKHSTKGVLLGLARNSELQGMIHTVDQIEASFNRFHHYPYLFLNDEPFTDDFKETIKSLTTAKVEFGLIPKEHWSIPDWIDEDRFKEKLVTMKKHGVMYGGLESYRHMCRFNSGFFYKHPMIQKYNFYWRIEPNVDYPCTLNYDPFVFMEISGKKYGFNLIANEDQRTVEKLWDTSMKFREEKKITHSPLLSLFGNEGYNGNHYW
jgi:hypothetical protein